MVELSYFNAAMAAVGILAAIYVLVSSAVKESRKEREDAAHEARRQGWRDNATPLVGRLELYDPARPDKPVLTASQSLRSLRRLLEEYESGFFS